MRKLIQFVLLLLMPYALFSQNVGIEMYKTDYLYHGVNNPFKVVVEDVPCESIFLELTSGTLTGANCEYNITVVSFKPVMISVLAISGTDTNHLRTYKYRVRSVPKPRAQLSNHWGDTISLSEFILQRGLVVQNDHWHLVGCGSFPILEFQIIVIRGDEFIGSYRNKGGVFQDGAKRLIKKTQVDDKIYFMEIKTHYGAAGKMTLDPKFYVLK